MVFDTRFLCVDLAGLELTEICLLGAGIKGVSHHPVPYFPVLILKPLPDRAEPKPSCSISSEVLRLDTPAKE